LLELVDTVVTNGFAGHNGGAILVKACVVTLTGSTVSDSVAVGSGGGIFGGSVLVREGSQVVGNQAHEGGGIRTSGSITVLDSVISGNAAEAEGGAIHMGHGADSVSIHNSTVSGNHAFLGGAISLVTTAGGTVGSLTGSFDTITWWENNGAFPPLFFERVISTTANAAEAVYAADVDGDGDVDVLSTSEFDDKIAWYEQLVNGVAPVSSAPE
jgi:hypothetical protein